MILLNLQSDCDTDSVLGIAKQPAVPPASSWILCQLCFLG